MFNSLSDEQKKIVFADLEKIVVRACPGSGKTFTVTARLANKISKWEDRYIGIAALSFTNTAWQEIEKNLPKFLGLSQIHIFSQDLSRKQLCLMPSPLPPMMMWTIQKLVSAFPFTSCTKVQTARRGFRASGRIGRLK